LQTDFPSTDPATPGVYQIRIATSGAGTADNQYFRADIQITGSTWTQIYPPPQSLAQSTTTTVTISPPSPQTVSTTVNITAAVTPSTATGTVQFRDAGANLGPAVAVTTGVATMSTNSLVVGPHSIDAFFAPGDPKAFQFSTSNPITDVINPTSAAPAFTAAGPPQTAAIGVPYSYTFGATGIPAPTFTVQSGTLPPGLTLDQVTGALRGTPTVGGGFTFTVAASNGVNPPAVAGPLGITVFAATPPAFTADSPPGTALTGSPYSYTFIASGTPRPSIGVASGSLPPGLTLDASTGLLSGTPVTAGSFTFTVQANNGVGSPATSPSIVIVVTMAPGSNGGVSSTGVSLTPAPVNFGLRAVGATSTPRVVLLTNNTSAALTGIKVSITGKGAAEFSLVADACSGTTVAPGATCAMFVAFTPAGGGLRAAVLDVADSAAGSPQTDPMSGLGVRTNGYWLGATDGGIFSFGGAGFFGSTGAVKLTKPIVAMAATPDGRGYWEAAGDGGIFAFGSAAFLGSTGSMHLNKPIVGMAATPDGLGYWLVASDGGIFAFGSAAFWGSAGSIRLNKPIVGMAATPDGLGYWLVASDGGLFSYGTAKFLGSVAGHAATKPIVGMAATPDGLGYWLVASDGGIFAYGTAPFLGSTGSVKLNQPIVAMAQSFTFGL
jgi:hypothetical protein